MVVSTVCKTFLRRKINSESSKSCDYTSSIPMRARPLTHPAIDAPLCCACKQLDLAFFDPSCPGCRAILRDPNTTVAEIFAILRQWVPQTQQNIQVFVNEILRRGSHVEDRDSLTDMTLLHYACKAGATGVGDEHTAVKAVQLLLRLGAQVQSRCRWTQMTALHYAAYFDVASVLRLLLSSNRGINVDDPCSEYDNGSPLHITARNLCLEAGKVLLEYGANLNRRDGLGRIPLECIPDASSFSLIPNVQELINLMCTLLSPHTHTERNCHAQHQQKNGLTGVSGKAVLKAMGLQLGDRVLIGGMKQGILRYCGTTEFATGIWAGIELDCADGKHDGVVKGVIYFHCKPNHGILAPINRVSKVGSEASRTGSLRRQKKISKSPEWGSNVYSTLPRRRKDGKDRGFSIGDRVLVLESGGVKRKGTIKFNGVTQFASGWWYGVDLDEPEGKNNGSFQGVRYFQCKHKHGVFAIGLKLTKINDEFNGNTTDRDSALSGMSSLCSNSSGTFRRTKSLRGNSTSPTNQSLCRSHSLRVKKKLPAWQPVGLGDSSPYWKPSESKFWLQEGMNVFYNHDVAVIKYIGPVDFTSGTWLGLELKSFRGKHDGMVMDRRYFTCKNGHGVIVRPKSVTVHGINGAKLVPQDDLT